MRKHNIKNKNEIPTVIKKLKQQLQAKTQRIRQYKKRDKSSSTRTKLFKTKKTPKKKLYRELEKKNIEAVENLWANIWGKKTP